MFPEAVAGMVSHLLVVVKAYLEVEEPGWRQKMAATGLRLWKEVDVHVFQETCGGFVEEECEEWRASGEG